MDPGKATTQPKHLDYIDAMRGIAVLGVISVHVSGLSGLNGTASAIFSKGAYGVQLFYVVSALTLMLSMKQRSKFEQRPLVNYFIRRLFRIAPAFYLVLAIYCISGDIRNAVDGSFFLPSPAKIALIVVFLNGWIVDSINAPVYGQWSIAVETTFYILLPLIFLVATSFRRATYVWWGSILLFLFANPLAMSLASLQGIQRSSDVATMFALEWIVTQLPVFVGGICLYYILSARIGLRQCLLFFTPGILMVLVGRYFTHSVRLLPIVGLGIVAFVAVISKYQWPLIVNKFTRLLGKISYSAYLCHPLLLPVVHGILHPFRGTNPMLRFMGAELTMILMVVPIAYFLWRYIESPFQKLGRHVIRTMTERVEMARVSK